MLTLYVWGLIAYTYTKHVPWTETSSMTISSVINHTADPPNSTSHRTRSGVEDVVSSPPVRLISTFDGWSPMFVIMNFVHDERYDRVFNVPHPGVPGVILEPESQPETDVSDFAKLTDMPEFGRRGFSYWSDVSVSKQIEHLRETYFWSLEAMETLSSIMESEQLQNVIKQWFKSTARIWHITYWRETGSVPIYLQRNTGRSDSRCLGLHLLAKDTVVRYYSGSHTATWPDKGEESSPSFMNFEQDIKNYPESEPVSNAL